MGSGTKRGRGCDEGSKEEAAELTGGVKHHAQNVWQHVGGGDKQKREPDEKKLQKEDREDKAYVTTMMVMAFLMMGLTAMAGIWIAVSAAVVTTGFVAIIGTGRRKKTARMMMMMMVLTAAADEYGSRWDQEEETEAMIW